MIVFDLKCGGEGHVFEGWFGSTEDYERQKRDGLLTCPFCGTPEVGKAVMAPRVAPKGNRRDEDGPKQDFAVSDPAAMKQMLAALAAAQREILAKSTYVGERFAEEARAIHLGETEARPIHGKATPAEAESLIEDGIEVAPLPFPVLEPGQEN